MEPCYVLSTCKDQLIFSEASRIGNDKCPRVRRFQRHLEMANLTYRKMPIEPVNSRNALFTSTDIHLPVCNV